MNRLADIPAYYTFSDLNQRAQSVNVSNVCSSFCRGNFLLQYHHMILSKVNDIENNDVESKISILWNVSPFPHRLLVQDRTKLKL